jgi:hypothetical protein
LPKRHCREQLRRILRCCCDETFAIAQIFLLFTWDPDLFVGPGLSHSEGRFRVARGTSTRPESVHCVSSHPRFTRPVSAHPTFTSPASARRTDRRRFVRYPLARPLPRRLVGLSLDTVAYLSENDSL